MVAKRQNWWAFYYVACTSLVKSFHFRKQFSVSQPFVIKQLESSLEYLRYSQTTSPLHGPEEVVLMAPDGLLGVSKRAAE